MNVIFLHVASMDQTDYDTDGRYILLKEEFEDTKGVIRNHHHNGQKKKDKQ